MKTSKRILSLLLCLVLLSAITVPTCFAYEYYPEDTEYLAKDSFFVLLKEEYYDKASEVISSIDCEYVTEVWNLSNPDFYDGPYSIMLCINLSDEEAFEAAQDYFRAQDYLLDISYEYIVGPLRRGDIDYDGEYTANDARLLLRAAVGLEDIPIQVGDVDGDGKITANDARLILRKSVGLED